MIEGIHTKEPWSEERRKRHSLIFTGRPKSKKHRDSMSRVRKGQGQPAWLNRKGTKWSEESRKKISESRKQFAALNPWSEERRKKHSDALKGRVVSEETRKKLSLKMKERKIPETFTQKGIKWSEERRKRWSEFQKGKSGKKHTLETRRLMSQIARSKRVVNVLDESKLARHRFEYKMWRQSIYTRDNYTCCRCGERGGKLNPHHIENFAEKPEIRYDINNGGTLCVQCHKDFHRKYGKKKNNRIQFGEFIMDKKEFRLLTDGKETA